MCWIAKGKADAIPVKYIKTAYRIKNKDGFGIMWHEDGQVKSLRTFSYREFREQMKALGDTEIVIHLRYATKGSLTLDNLHPFEVNDDMVMHNGTIFSLSASSTCGDSDSKIFADLLAKCKYSSIADIEPLLSHVITDKVNRIVYLDTTGKITIFNENLGITEGSNWYSNDYHLQVPKPKPKLTKVFVYGTLKQGFNNHPLIAASNFLFSATSVAKWCMIGEDMPFPYLLKQDYRGDLGGLNIKGEVYEVDDDTLARLDRLEGYPTHYTKVPIIVRPAGQFSNVVATVYIKTRVTATDLEKPFIDNFNPYTMDRPWTPPKQTSPADTILAYADIEPMSTIGVYSASVYECRLHYEELFTAFYGRWGAADKTEMYSMSITELQSEILELQELIQEEIETAIGFL